MSCMNEEVIRDKLETHEKRINNHADRIDQLERYQSRSEEQIKNLCEQIKNLVTTMKWFMGLFVSALIGFFIWYVQSL